MAVLGRLDVIEEVIRVTWEDMHLRDHREAAGFIGSANLALEN